MGGAAAAGGGGGREGVGLLAESRHWEWSGCPRERYVLDKTETTCFVGRYHNERFFFQKEMAKRRKRRAATCDMLLFIPDPYTDPRINNLNDSWTSRLEIPRDIAIAGGRSGCEVKRVLDFGPGSDRLQDTDKLRRFAGGGIRPRPRASSLGVTSFSQVAMLGVR